MTTPVAVARQPREKILLVDDVPENLAVLTAALEPEGYEILAVSSGATALKVAAKARPSLILMDVLMPEMDGLETCRFLKLDESLREIPVIFITARNEMASMVEGFRAGGVDYIIKPFQTDEVLSRVATHLRLSRLTLELREKNRALEARTTELTEEMERRREAETALKHADEKLAVISGLEAERWNLAGLVGGSRLIRKITDDIRRLHQFAHTSVLILGESGTGKELVARAVHFDSVRAKGPFIPVNCVAIPADLAESMLFGHVKGAFTGATADRKGYFELAHGGTLFLDEIGDMPASLQVKLLRVIEDGCVTPVGASRPTKVDVRIIAATNADLDARIAAGMFRQDLYFRLARYVVATPPLRERPEDIPVLATHFLRLFAAEMGLKAPSCSSEALEALQEHDYPGNVRELKNVIERALIESGGGAIRAEHLGLPVKLAPVSVRPAKVDRKEAAATLPLNLAEAEELLIQRALQETGGNIADAARMLGVHRTRIYRKLAQ
ncbi:MAG TPA: sigma-54 dependent transcriptional regulator [Candidatus Limnocylindria bacterium]|jgi:DNA-binding NtrC family response regulator|nr:sigma-54 dependent transcriptional regulator [Candidatus Limnocylindria bacterium]